LTANRELIAETSDQPTRNNGNGKRMGIVLWRHSDNFSLNEFDVLPIKDPDFGHAVILGTRKMAGCRLGNGHGTPQFTL